MSEDKKMKHHYTLHFPRWRRSGAGFTLIELLIVAAMFSTVALIATTVFSNVQSRQRQIQGKQRISADGRYVVETIARSVRTESLNYALYPNSEAPSTATMLSTINQAGTVTCYLYDTTDPTAKSVRIKTNAKADCSDAASGVVFTPEDIQVEALNFYISPKSDPFRSIPRSTSDCKITPPVSRTIGSQSFVVQGFDSSIGACMCQTSADCNSSTCTLTSPEKFSCTSGLTPGKACIGLTDFVTCGVGGTCDQASPQRLICTNPNVQPHVTIYLSTKSQNTSPGEKASTVIQTTVTSRIYQ